MDYFIFWKDGNNDMVSRAAPDGDDPATTDPADWGLPDYAEISVVVPCDGVREAYAFGSKLIDNGRIISHPSDEEVGFTEDDTDDD